MTSKEKYGISDIVSIRDSFCKYNEYENLVIFHKSKNFSEPLAYE